MPTNETQRITGNSLLTTCLLTNPNILDDSLDMLAESLHLHLPSELSSSDRDYVCTKGIADIEARVCHADTSEALDDFRWYPHTCTFLNKWQVKNMSGSIKAHVCMDCSSVDVKVHSAKTRYRHSCNAYLVLEGHGDWGMTGCKGWLWAP